MADTTDTPSDSPKPSAKPTPQRRRPARSATAKPPAKPGPTKAAPSAPPADTDEASPPTAPAPKKRATTPKPRSTNRATPAPKRRPPAPIVVEPPEPVAKPTRRWTKAALVGSVAAIGAAALLSLRGSACKGTSDRPPPSDVSPAVTNAHTPAGQDASVAFEARIVDDYTIPDKA